MRFALIILVIVFAVLGALFGALNGDSVGYDFYFRDVHLPKGAALLLALFAGWLCGGLLVYWRLVLPLRSRTRAQSREIKRLQTTVAGADSSAGTIIDPPRDA